MAVISKVGAALRELSLGGVQMVSHQAAGKPDSMFFGSLLAPWPNRLARGRFSFAGEDLAHPKLDPAGNANHGLLFDRSVDIASHSESSVSFEYSFGGDDVYPFLVDLMVTYTISDDEFRFDAQAKNRGDKAPFGMGFHPYFLVGEDFTFTADFTQHINVDEKMIPISENSLAGFSYSGGDIDDCFYGAKTANLKTANYELELTLETGFKYLMLYKPKHPSVNMLAIEPMSCRTNAFNTHPAEVLLAGDETKSYSFTIKKR